MNITARSYLTSGIAALGVGVIALTPIQPLPDHLSAAPQRAVESLAVNLAATIDPFTPWVDTFKTSFANLQTLLNFYLDKPVPLLQTVGANIGTYFGELTSGQAGLIPGQITNNIKTFFEAPWWNAPGTPIVNGKYPSDYISNTQTISGVGFKSQSGVYNLAAPLLASQGPAWLGPVLEFTATPYSGELIGLLSPVLSSVVQLTRSFTAIGQFFKDGDVLGAINELINIPAATTNAFLNGAGNLDLTALVLKILPPELAPIIKSFGLNLGGLISPPVPFDGNLTNPNKLPTVFTGGTLWDGVQTTTAVGAETTGLQVGWGQSVIGLGQFLGRQLLVTPPAPGATVAAAASAPGAAAATPAMVAR